MIYRDEVMELEYPVSLLYVRGFRIAQERSADIAARADARIAELERDIERLDAQWREELRIYRESGDARIAELVDLLTECRDCVASDINHTLAQFHEPAAVDYLHALLMRVDAALARAGNGGGE